MGSIENLSFLNSFEGGEGSKRIQLHKMQCDGDTNSFIDKEAI